jgi:competence ComEA-like helix-hairpin-helix protein
MFKKFLLAAMMCFAAWGVALAAPVNVNTADQAALESIKGLGPAKSAAILEERKKNGPFKDAADLANRVKGMGDKSVAKLVAEGLTFGPGGAKSAAKADTKAAPTPAKADTKAAPAPAKADAKKDEPKKDDKKAEAKK